MIDNRQTLRKALDILKAPLLDFVRRRMESRYGPQLKATEPRLFSSESNDIQVLLSIVLDHWPATFRSALPNVARGWVHELKSARNAWAHEQPVSLDEAYRAIDSVELLLGSMNAPRREEISELKRFVRSRMDGSRVVTVSNASRAKPEVAPPPQFRAPHQSELFGRVLRIAGPVLQDGNPRVPNTHGWLAFEVLRRSADGGRLLFDDYHRHLFHPSAEIERLASGIPGVPNAYQDIKHIRHDIAKGRVLVESRSST